MTIFAKMGPYIFPQKERNDIPLKKLPTSVYTLEHNPMQGFFLKEADDFKITGKIYGNLTTRTDRIINTFLDRTVSTGVLLAGEKGSGKTLLAKNVTQELLKKNISTIIISSAYHGPQFNEFMAIFDEPVCVIFDEYEKVYREKEHQEALLTLFDGVFQSKMLFMLTCNKKHLVDDNMINRPGRIYYNYEYSGLDMEFVREYLEDNLVDQSDIDGFIRYCTNMIDNLNFDMLKAMVEELNRYKEPLKEAVSHLNITTYGIKKKYRVAKHTAKNGLPKTVRDFHPKGSNFIVEGFNQDVSGGDYANPFKDRMYVTLEYSYEEDGETEHEEHYIYLNSENIVTVGDDKVVMETEDFKFQLEELKPKVDKDYWDYQNGPNPAF